MSNAASILLFALFAWLKLTGQIDWSWWVVTLPLWYSLAVFFVVAIFGGGVLAVVMAWVEWDERRSRRRE